MYSAKKIFLRTRSIFFYRMRVLPIPKKSLKAICTRNPKGKWFKRKTDKKKVLSIRASYKKKLVECAKKNFFRKDFLDDSLRLLSSRFLILDLVVSNFCLKVTSKKNCSPKITITKMYTFLGQIVRLPPPQ